MLNEKSQTGHAAVIGAGVMGSGIAAMLANFGWRVDLLDIVANDRVTQRPNDPTTRSRLAREGLDRALKARPPQFVLPEYANRIRVGNTEDNLEWVREADWVVEAVAEDPAIKKALMERLAGLVGPDTVASSNTSALSLSAMVSGCPHDFRTRFLGTHFFNPPRYMTCLELAPTGHTDSAVFDGFARFADRILGKRIIRAKDTPGFISTRLGMYNLVKTIELAVHHHMTIEQADYLTGPLIGRPKSGTFRLADVIGLDITAKIIDYLKIALPNDGAFQALEVPDIMRRLIADGRIGAKVGTGFYKREKSGELLSLDLDSGEYRPRVEPIPAPADIERLPLKERLSELLGSHKWDNKALQKIDLLVIDGMAYMEDMGPKVSDTIVDVDDAMMFGFGWEMGPFQILDAIGEGSTTGWAERYGGRYPFSTNEMHSFYRNEFGNHSYFDYRTGKLEPLPRPADVIVLKDLKKAGRTIEDTERTSLVDLGEGVACFEWRGKLNVLDPEIIGALDSARARAERDFRALVLGGSGDHFSAGFNIDLFVQAIESQDWDGLDRDLRQFQDTLTRIKYATIPVVSLAYGYTLGGGCEVMLHADAVQAAFESSVGLPEANVGLIPAGGGTTERLLRVMAEVPPGTVLERPDTFPFVRPVWETLRQGKFSSSADEARQLGFLRESDGITRHPDRILHDARERASGMAASYISPEAPRIMAMGEDGHARFQWEINLLRRADQITEHDARIAEKLAWVLCGGDLIHPAEITEQHLFDLEREAFLSLCGTPETLARIKHMRTTGKPLRN